MAHPLDQSPFYRLRNRKKLAQLLGLTAGRMERLANGAGGYWQFENEDSKGKTRQIQVPKPALRHVHDRVADLLSRIQAPGCLHCPVKRRSNVTNAMAHAGADQVHTLDIQSYFPSTTARQVAGSLHSVMGCSPDVASVLAKLLTVDGHLATGSPVSPILSFYAHYELWMAVAAAVEGAGCTLTIYMDDVTLSGRVVPDWLVWEVKRRIGTEGLRYHKEQRYDRGWAEVTGVVLRDGGGRVPQRQHKKAHELRKALHAERDTEAANTLRSKLGGVVAQRKYVERMSRSAAVPGEPPDPAPGPKRTR